jgi:hypothetical protein
MNRSFFHAILFIATLFGVFSLVQIHAEAALDIHAGYANDWRSLQGDELPYTYGKTVVENMWTSGRWAYSTHSIFIGNYAGGDFGPQDIDFDVTYVCEIKGTDRQDKVFQQSVKLLKPYYDFGSAKATWSDNNRQLSVRRDGLPNQTYTFVAYTELDARDADRPRDSATWRAEHSMMIEAF